MSGLRLSDIALIGVDYLVPNAADEASGAVVR